MRTKTREDRGPVYTHNDYFVTWITRFFAVTCALAIYIYSSPLQTLINDLWSCLLTWDLFHSAYFETLYVTGVYAIMIAIPYTMHYIRYLDKYKVDPTVEYQHKTLLQILWEAVVYISPLAALDAVYIKKYVGVDPDLYEEKRKSWIHITRALPFASPSLFAIIFGVIATIILYDAIFFVYHYILHWHPLLYKHIHFAHHDHESIHCHITNKLTILDRLTLVLSANIPLKLLGAHPLTRCAFVPVLLWLLVDNHAGYDVPWGLHRVIPFGIVGGPAVHFDHHKYGTRNYQPFLTYLDGIFKTKKHRD